MWPPQLVVSQHHLPPLNLPITVGVQCVGSGRQAQDLLYRLVGRHKTNQHMTNTRLVVRNQDLWYGKQDSCTLSFIGSVHWCTLSFYRKDRKDSTDIVVECVMLYIRQGLHRKHYTNLGTLYTKPYTHFCLQPPVRTTTHPPTLSYKGRDLDALSATR